MVLPPGSDRELSSGYANCAILSIQVLGCWELTTLWVARLDYGAELKVTDPKEQQGDIEEEEAGSDRLLGTAGRWLLTMREL